MGSVELSIRHPAPVPFPSSDLNTAPLIQVSLSKLQARDETEANAVFEACKTAGFFTLDLQNDALGEELLKDVDALMKGSEEVFGIPLEEKQKFALQKGGFSGYKGIGKLKIDSKGTPDRNEFFGVLKDELLGIAPELHQPDVIKSSRDLYASFTRKAHQVAMIILSNLEKSLDLPTGTLGALHRISAPSDDQSRLIRYTPQPSDDRRMSFVAHTDFGTITILFTVLGGLQILSDRSVNDWNAIPDPDHPAWQFVRPVPGCAIINLGDAMTKFTNGLLQSNLHRVVSAPGEQGNLVRISLGYFVRPERDVVLKRLDYGEVIPPLGEGVVEEGVTSAGWIDKKGSVRKVE